MRKVDSQAISEEDSDPEFLYRYRPLHTEKGKEHWTEDIFLKNQLYFPSPKQFNDPFDCAIPPVLDGPPEKLTEHLHGVLQRKSPDLGPAERKRIIDSVIPDKIERLAQDFCKRQIERFSKIGVLSLTEKRDDILMWALYAAGHTGLCLEFKASSTTPFFGWAQPVVYSEAYPQVNILKNTSDESTSDERTQLILIKSDHWAYESEWRIIEHDNGYGTYQFPPELLTGVIFGCRMTEENKEKIKQWIKEGKCKPRLYQAKRKKNEFGLDIMPIR